MLWTNLAQQLNVHRRAQDVETALIPSIYTSAWAFRMENFFYP